MRTTTWLLSAALVAVTGCAASDTHEATSAKLRASSSPSPAVVDAPMGPGCGSQGPYIVDAANHSHVTLTRPVLHTALRKRITITFGLDEIPTQPITDGEIVVTSPNTSPGRGFNGAYPSSGTGTFDDRTTHLETVHYEPASAPTSPDTRYFTVSFTPTTPGSYPVFNYQANDATAPCGGIQQGAVGENIVAWIDAS